MRIIHLTNTDEGGAGIAVKRTHQRLIDLGYESILIVKKDVRDNDSTIKKLYKRVKNKFSQQTIYSEKYCFFSKNELIKQSNNKLLSKIKDHDILIFYWIGDGFINLETIKEINNYKRVKIFWYSVDMAPFTGGCHYFWNCLGYTQKCENCPAVLSGDTNLPKLQFEIKNEIAKEIEINILASSFTGLSLMKKSNIKYYNYSVLPYAINTEVFNLSKKKNANSIKKIFFNAQNVTDPRKGYNILVEIIITLKNLLLNKDYLIEFMCVDNISSFQHLESPNLKFVNYDKPINSELSLANLYNQADLFLCTSIEDLSPLMVNEALLCGVPVITFNNASNSEYITNGVNGILIDNFNIKLFANSIFDFTIGKYNFSDALEIRNSILPIHEKQNWSINFKKILNA